MTSRRLWYFGAALAYTAIIAVVVWGLVGLYQGARAQLDQALGDRLLGTAGTLAVMVDTEQVFHATLGDTTAAIYLDLLAADFLNLTRRWDLAEITLSDPEGQVLVSTSPALAVGQAHAFWALDRPAVEQALAGTPATSSLYRLDTTFQKSAHVPVMKDDPFLDEGFVVAVLTVSGNPRFFAALEQLRTGAFVTGGLVLLVLAVLGYLLHRISRALENFRASMQRQENLAAMGRMTAGIAHEIRNPLGIIRGAGQHLQGVLKRAGIEDEVATFIPEEVDRLDAILSGYLAFGTDSAFPVEVFDLDRVVRRSCDLLRSELEQGGIAMELDLGDGLHLEGDSRRLQQVLLNLLLNARDAMPDGGPLRVVLDRLNDEICLQIIDSGTGLGKTEPAQLFAPFFTTKEKGSGLGLATSRRIIEDMGGTLHLHRRQDAQGTVAEIRWPFVAPKEG